LALEAKGSRMEAIYTLLSKLVFPTYNFYTRFDSDFQAFSLQRERKKASKTTKEKNQKVEYTMF
jgi:hypothetical protein